MRPFNATSREEITSFCRHLSVVYGRDIPVKVKVRFDPRTGEVLYRVRWKVGRKLK